MIKLGEVLLDDEKGKITLELQPMVEDNFTEKEDAQVQILWEKLAAKIENALRTFSNKEMM